MANGMTRRGAIIGVGAVSAASCATAGTGGKTGGPSRAKPTGNSEIEMLQLSAAELMDYALFGATIRAIVHNELYKRGKNKSGVVDIGFTKSEWPETGAEAHTGCCLVPVSISEGEPLRPAGADPKEAYRKVLETIGIKNGVSPFGCVKC